jgi:hypothetical protein
MKERRGDHAGRDADDADAMPPELGAATVAVIPSSAMSNTSARPVGLRLGRARPVYDAGPENVIVMYSST